MKIILLFISITVVTSCNCKYDRVLYAKHLQECMIANEFKPDANSQCHRYAGSMSYICEEQLNE